MNFKELLDHYNTLEKDELIEKLVLKNAKILVTEKENDRLNEELQRVDLLEQQHKELNGKLTTEINQLRGY